MEEVTRKDLYDFYFEYSDHKNKNQVEFIKKYKDLKNKYPEKERMIKWVMPDGIIKYLFLKNIELEERIGKLENSVNPTMREDNKAIQNNETIKNRKTCESFINPRLGTKWSDI